MSRLVIAGARYYSPEDKAILIPHFTGEYADVDCTRYLTDSQIAELYCDPDDVVDWGNIIDHNGVCYTYAEYSVFEVTEKWELMSDLSNLQYEGD